LNSENIIQTIEKLTGTDDYSGEPLRLLPFQKDILHKLFEKEGGRYKHTKSFIFLPRAQGKTTLLASVVVALLLIGPAGQQIISVASDHKQAALIFDKARQMIEADDYLRSLFIITPTFKKISRGTSFYQALSAQDSNKFGYNPSFIIADEVSEWKKRDVWDKLVSAQGKRTKHGGQAVAITTANELDRESLAYELFEYACKVKETPALDPNFLPVLYYADPTEDWHDRAVWKRVMPALGTYCSEAFIESEYREALQLPTAEFRFRTLYLNTWLDDAIAFIKPSDFEQCKAEIKTEGECFLGIDLASTQDLSCICAMWPDYSIKSWFYCPKLACKVRQRLNKTRYDQWVNANYIEYSGEEITKNEVIEAKIKELCETYNVTSILMDRYNAVDLATRLINTGLQVQFPSLTPLFLNAPMKELQRLVLEKKLKWDGNPVMRWCVGNVRCTLDRHENYFPDKKKSIEKIDGAIALLLCVARRLLDSPSIYEQMADTYLHGSKEESKKDDNQSRTIFLR
jgi:phage terminase large subunit-like protein